MNVGFRDPSELKIGDRIRVSPASPDDLSSIDDTIKCFRSHGKPPIGIVVGRRLGDEAPVALWEPIGWASGIVDAHSLWGALPGPGFIVPEHHADPWVNYELLPREEGGGYI